jgi:hypothetical protein
VSWDNRMQWKSTLCATEVGRSKLSKSKTGSDTGYTCSCRHSLSFVISLYLHLPGHLVCYANYICLRVLSRHQYARVSWGKPWVVVHDISDMKGWVRRQSAVKTALLQQLHLPVGKLMAWETSVDVDATFAIWTPDVSTCMCSHRY